MSPETYDQMCGRYPDLANRVLAQLVFAAGRQVDPHEVEWTLIECHDDFDQPLDEAGCADVMLLSELPCRHGVAGRCAGYFACFCEEDCLRTM